MMTMTVLHLCRRTSCVLCKTRQGYQAAGFCSIANRLLTCFVTQNYWAISVMQNVLYGNVAIAIDIMYINEIPFLMTTSCTIHFGTAEMIKKVTKSTIIKSIQQIFTRITGADSKLNTY